MPQRSQSTNQPEKKFGPYPGGVGVAIWLNEIDTDQGTRMVRSITINPRRYFDEKNNQWRDSKSFRPEDLPAVIFGLQKALEHCYLEPIPGHEPSHAPAPSQEETPF